MLGIPPPSLHPINSRSDQLPELTRLRRTLRRAWPNDILATRLWVFVCEFAFEIFSDTKHKVYKKAPLCWPCSPCLLVLLETTSLHVSTRPKPAYVHWHHFRAPSRICNLPFVLQLLLSSLFVLFFLSLFTHSILPDLAFSLSFRIALSLLGGTSDKGDVLIGTFLRFQIQLEQEARFQSMLG